MLSIKKFLLFCLVGLLPIIAGQSVALAAPPAQETGDVEAAHLYPGEPVGYVRARWLNVRTGPATHFQAIGHLNYSEAIHLVGRNAEMSWLQIRLWNGNNGWVSARYVEASHRVIRHLPITDGHTPPPVDSVGYVSSYRLNVRSGSGLSYPIIHRLHRGESVLLRGRNPQGTWLQVQVAPSGLGWVSANYIWSNLSIWELPVVDEGPSPQPLTGTVGVYRLNVRSGPGRSYGVTERVRYGEQVYLNGRNAAGTWLKISLSDSGEQGWVSARYIWSKTPVSHLPVVW